MPRRPLLARPRPTARWRWAATPAAAALVAALVGCSSADPGGQPDPPSQSASAQLLTSHVHGVGIDPGDGAVLVATHEGLVEIAPDGEVEPVGPVIDLMGFAVAGPDHYVASGHPGLHVDLPNPVGLIETTDGGHTWSPVSRQEVSDFHSLTVSSSGFLGFDGSLLRSADGRAWEQLGIPAEPHTLAASPDGTSVLATTRQGLLRSTDGAASWSFVDGAPLLQVVSWIDGEGAVGVTPEGAVWSSADGGTTWREAAGLGAAPEALTAAGGDGTRIVAVTTDAVLESRDGAASFAVLLTR